MNLKLFCIVIILTSLAEFGLLAEDWEYYGSTGPDHWPELEPICGRSSQSPIDIKTNYLYPNPGLGLLSLTGYMQNLTGGVFTNNGHSAQLNFPEGKSFQLSGEGIEGTYTALQLHFHWIGKGSTTGGSEHTVNGQYYDAEMHIVHIKDPHTSVDDIKDMKDGLAVLGVFLKAESGAADNPNYQSLLNLGSQIRNKGDTADLTNGPTLLSLLPGSGTYYRYYGSLTTPPCYETVLWTVYQQPVVISESQLGILQGLSPAEQSKTGDELLGDNYRPVQPLHGRIVSVYYDVDVSDGTEHGWGYEGEKDPSHWHQEYPHCRGMRQSPIDFHSKDSARSQTLKKLEISGQYLQSTSGRLENNGHSVVFTLDQNNGSDFMVNDKNYRVLQFHFHWGGATVNDKALSHMGGSEHTVDGQHFPIEMHIVHKKIGDDGNADDDLAVLGIFFNINEDAPHTDRPARGIQTIADAFKEIVHQGDEVAVSKGPVLVDFFPSDWSYYRYMGSLTTPPCSETVLWTVFVNPVDITKDIFLVFQNLFKVMQGQIQQKNSTSLSDGSDDMSLLKKLLLINNFRPTQEYNDREVHVYVDESAAPQTNTLLIVLFTGLGIGVFAGILAMMIFCKRRQKIPEAKPTDFEYDYTKVDAKPQTEAYPDPYADPADQLIKQEMATSTA